MSDLEQLVRDDLRFEGGPVNPIGLEADALIGLARRRRLARRLRAGAAVGAVGGLATVAVWTGALGVDSEDGVTATEAPSLSTAESSITTLAERDRVVTPERAVIEVEPGKICVGNTHEDQPACLVGEDIDLDDGEDSLLSFWTDTPTDFVYAWLVPADAAEATMQIGPADAREASLFRIEGRSDVAIAVVTGAECWSVATPVTLVATDFAGDLVHKRVPTEAGTCP